MRSLRQGRRWARTRASKHDALGCRGSGRCTSRTMIAGNRAGGSVQSESTLNRLKIASRRFSSAPVLLDLIADLLAIGEAPQPGTFNGRYMNENVRSAGIGLDEPKAFCRIKPLHRTCSHASTPCLGKAGNSHPRGGNLAIALNTSMTVVFVSLSPVPSASRSSHGRDVFWSSALRPARRGMRDAGWRLGLPSARMHGSLSAQ